MSVSAVPRRIAILGPRQSGKTTTLLELIRHLVDAGVQVGGVTQPAWIDGGRLQGYRLRDVATGEERPFATRVRLGRGYQFVDEGWAWARTRITRAREDADVVVVDELGRLEAEGEGHFAALTNPLSDESATLQLLGVRLDREPLLRERLGPWWAVLRTPAEPGEVERLLGALSPER